MERSTNNGIVLANPKKLPLVSKSKEEDEAYLKSMPPGYRFKPRDDELVDYYLKRKVNGKSLPPNIIREVHLYNYDPETLTEMNDNKSSNGTVSEWYFFTPRERKYKNGKRPGRGTGNGFWKAAGADKHVMRKGNLVGLKKTLVFFLGKPPKGDKTNWIMHEFVLSNPPVRERTSEDDMRLDDWVLCRVYKKEKEGKSKLEIPKQKHEEAEDSIPPQTKMSKQENGILPTQSNQQFQVQDFNMQLPQPFSNDEYDNSTFEGLPPLAEPSDPILENDSTMFSHQEMSSYYGCFMPTALPISSIPPPDNQFNFIGNDNFNMPQQQQQFSGTANNFELSAADEIQSKMDFCFRNIRHI
ncbi:hypothetical protein REPUB_Repub03eG0219100 [Reevesia pubescens]